MFGLGSFNRKALSISQLCQLGSDGSKNADSEFPPTQVHISSLKLSLKPTLINGRLSFWIIMGIVHLARSIMLLIKITPSSHDKNSSEIIVRRSLEQSLLHMSVLRVRNWSVVCSKSKSHFGVFLIKAFHQDTLPTLRKN